MKKIINRSSKLLIVVAMALGMVQVAFAEEAVVSEKQKVATETVDSQPEQVEESQEPTSSTAEVTEKTVDSQKSEETPVTKKEVEEINTDVDTFIKEVVGEPAGEVVDLTTDYSASTIREQLLTGDYGITKADLDKYSDQQLEDAMTLFTRYNYDISGMDLGAYVRLLSTLYVDKTVSIDNALAQLAFNPAIFSSFAEMIPQIEALQLYLKTLYPVNSSFIPGKTFTNDELIAILKNLTDFEAKVKAEGGSLAGRITYILNAKDYGEPKGTDSSSDAKDKEQTGDSSQPAKVKAEQKDNKFRLPQTGEEKAKLTLIIVGVILVVGVVIVMVSKRKKSN